MPVLVQLISTQNMELRSVEFHLRSYNTFVISRQNPNVQDKKWFAVEKPDSTYIPDSSNEMIMAVQ